MPYAKIEPSGCGIHKGRTKLRLDFFLNPSDPNYDKYPDTPFHSHFIYPDKDASDADIKAEIEKCLNYFYAFHQHCWDKKVNFIHEWRKVPHVKGSVRDVFVKGEPKDLSANQGKIQNIILRAAEFQLGVSKVSPQNLNIGEKETIDVGSPAIDRAGAGNLVYYTASWNYRTYVEGANPANASGEIDTVEAWFSIADAGNSVKYGTFEHLGSNELKCHDAEVYGEVSSGSKQTCTGLSIAISSGEYIGVDGRAEQTLHIERDLSGGTHVWFQVGQFCDPNDQTTFTLFADDTLSLYGTGTEAGGLEYTRSGTASLGLLGVGTRPIGYVRSDIGLLGLLATATRSWALSREDTALLGLKATAVMSTVQHYIRSGIAYLGLKTTAIRTLSLTRMQTALLGLKAIAISIWGITGRKLRLVIVTAQYRKVNVISSLKRKVRILTGV